MTISEPTLRPDLEETRGGQVFQWVEYPNCTLVNRVGRGVQVASECWYGLKAISASAIHSESYVRDVHVRHFGTMIVLRRTAERVGLPLPVVESEDEEGAIPEEQEVEK